MSKYVKWIVKIEKLEKSYSNKVKIYEPSQTVKGKNS